MPHARTDGARAPTTIIAQATVPPPPQASGIAHFPLLKIDRPSPVGHHDVGSDPERQSADTPANACIQIQER